MVKNWLSQCLISCVRFARYCSKMYSRHLFSYGGFTHAKEKACEASAKQAEVGWGGGGGRWGLRAKRARRIENNNQEP